MRDDPNWDDGFGEVKSVAGFWIALALAFCLGSVLIGVLVGIAWRAGAWVAGY